jgi:hypothetical protein
MNDRVDAGDESGQRRHVEQIRSSHLTVRSTALAPAGKHDRVESRDGSRDVTAEMTESTRDEGRHACGIDQGCGIRESCASRRSTSAGSWGMDAQFATSTVDAVSL